MFREIFLPPLLACKKQLLLLFFALLVITMMQALFLLLTGPIMTVLLSASQEKLNLSQLSPLAAQLLPELRLPRTFLLLWLPVLLAMSGVIKSVCGYLFRYSQNYIALWLAKHLRQELCAAIIAQPYTVFLRRPAAHWMSVIMNDTFLLQVRFSDIMTCFIKNTAQVCICVVMLALIHYPSAVLLVLLAAVLTLVLRNVSQRIVALAEEYQAKLAIISSQVLDIRKRFEFISSQGGVKLEMQHFSQSSHAYYRAIRRSLLIRTGLSPLSEFVGVMIFATVVLLINQRLWLLDSAPVVIVQFLVALGLVLKPLRNFTDQLSAFQETKGALQSCLKVLAAPRQQAKNSAATPPLSKNFTIARVVIPCDKDDELVFNALPIKFGTITALIGSSGAGKSSLAKVLAGLLTPAQWQCEHELATVNAQVSYAGQQPFLFDDTLYGNLCYGLNADADTSARIDYYLRLFKLEKDMNTRFNPLTPELSGGQVQKLTIIRALLRPATMLVLDEITAAIDMEMERNIIAELRKTARAEHRWVLVITHRQQLLATFDQVWFAQRNQPLLQGKHQELLAHAAAYREFCADTE